MTTADCEIQPMTANPFAPRPDMICWVGNQLVPVAEASVSVFDHGLLYGDGVFEGIRVYNGKIFKEREHIQRFFESSKAIRLAVPMTREDVSRAMHETMAANGVTEDGYLRLLLTRGVGSLGISIKHTACPNLIVIADKISLYPAEVYERGLRCMITSITRNHPNSTSPRVKSLNYLNNIMAKLDAQDAGMDEAIMLNIYGRVCECTGDNIFLVRENEIHTPGPSEGILDGITRRLVMDLARKRGYFVHESLLIRHDLYVADEIFATGTAAEVVPIVEVDHRVIGDGKPGRITKELNEDFVAYRNSY